VIVVISVLMFGGVNQMQAQPVDINARIVELVRQIEHAEPSSVTEVELGMALVGAASEAHGTVTEETVDAMAALIGSGGANARVFDAVSRTVVLTSNSRTTYPNVAFTLVEGTALNFGQCVGGQKEDDLSRCPSTRSATS
jgi:hypothetical protein